ncbi:MAG: hypothetical protein LC113_04115 [Acidobacteria bacterium]|nr:hypothetical protein [Acidobacteriota bacterium]
MEQTSGPGNVAGRACSGNLWGRCVRSGKPDRTAGAAKPLELSPATAGYVGGKAASAGDVAAGLFGWAF